MASIDGSSNADSEEGMTPSALWKVGDSWNISVELYSRDWMIDFRNPERERLKNVPRVLARYTMHVKISGKEQVSEPSCLQVDFIPGKDAPSGIREQQYRVLVAKENGSARKLIQLTGKQQGNPSVVTLEDVTMIRNAPYGFPLEFLSVKRKIAAKSKDGTLFLTVNTEVTDQSVMEVRLKIRDEEESMVRQRWVAGANWWNEYEKDYMGHKEVHARIIPAQK